MDEKQRVVGRIVIFEKEKEKTINRIWICNGCHSSSHTLIIEKYYFLMEMKRR